MPSQSGLSNRHAVLETRIETEMKRPAPDSVKLQTLKKEKLAIKEKMT